MGKELNRMYDINNILVKEIEKLRNLCLSISYRNSDTKGLDELASSVKELSKELSKIN